jgi:hypothetical protein
MKSPARAGPYSLTIHSLIDEAQDYRLNAAVVCQPSPALIAQVQRGVGLCAGSDGDAARATNGPGGGLAGGVAGGAGFGEFAADHLIGSLRFSRIADIGDGFGDAAGGIFSGL